MVQVSVVEDHCLFLIDVIGRRVPITYDSVAQRTEAQFAFIALISSLAQYSRSSSFDARNSLGVGVHMPKSVHVALYEIIIALLSRPEFDFRRLIRTSTLLKGSAAHVAGEYWRVLLIVLQLVLDLVVWAREEEMHFAAKFFAMAIFRLPSVGGHVVDSLHQFHSRAAAHYRRLYPASTRSSEVDYAMRQRMRIKRSVSSENINNLALGRKNRTIETKSSPSNTSSDLNSSDTSTPPPTFPPSTSHPTVSPTPPPTPSTPPITSSPITSSAASAFATKQQEKKLQGRGTFARTRSSSKQSFDFIHANPVIFGWLTFQSKVPGVDSGRVVELMRKRKREWNGRLRSSREFGMMLAAAVVDHVQDVIVSTDHGIWWEEVPLYPVLADMVLLTLRRQFHLLVHPTDPSALDDYETRTALRASSGSYNFDGGSSHGNNNSLGNVDKSAIFSDGSGGGRMSHHSSSSSEDTEEQEGNLTFSRAFFDTIVQTCSHFFSADPIMRSALLRMVCRHMDPERVSSVGPCLGAIESWLLRLHTVSPVSMSKAMQLPCIRSTISSLLRSSRFVCTCRGLTFITTVVQHLSGTDEEALVWFLRDILFDHFFDLMLSWSSFIRRFFQDFLVYRVFKLKRSLLDIPSDRRIFEMFPGNMEENEGDSRVKAYDLARREFATNRRRKRQRSKGARTSRAASTSLTSENHRPDAATLSPSDMALATKMEAYMRILLNALNDPSSFDDRCCRNADQRRGYIRVSLESFSDQLFVYYCERKDEPGYFEGDPPEMDISIDSLMKRFAE
jgi:hypothetical protein